MQQPARSGGEEEEEEGRNNTRRRPTLLYWGVGGCCRRLRWCRGRKEARNESKRVLSAFAFCRRNNKRYRSSLPPHSRPKNTRRRRLTSPPHTHHEKKENSNATQLIFIAEEVPLSFCCMPRTFLKEAVCGCFFCWNLSPAGPPLGLALARASGGARSNSSFSSLSKEKGGGDRRLGVLPPPTPFPPSFFPKMSEVHLGPPFLPPKEAIWRISRQLARRRRGGGGRGVCSDERRKEEEERLSMFSQRRRRRSMEKEEEESAEEDF